MYAGHLGIALAGKGVRRDAPLWLLVLGTQGCDWVQMFACVAAPPGTSAMWSHSIPAAAALAAVLSLSAYLLTRDRGVALLTGAITLSHLLADYVTGAKPTWPGGPTIGLNLYDRPFADLVIEAGVVTAGWLVYRRSLPLESRTRRLTWLLLAALLGIQLLAALELALFPRMPKCW